MVESDDDDDDDDDGDDDDDDNDDEDERWFDYVRACLLSVYRFVHCMRVK